MREAISTYFNKSTHAAPLAVFRIFFGLMMLASIVRFWANGWIKKLYIDPQFFFSYYGFEFVKPLGQYTYLLFIICGFSAFGVALGYKYRLSIIIFFLSFTYIELMDKTTYLNHYYFISLLSFVMIFLPASVYFSIDAKRNSRIAFEYIPAWTIDTIKLLLAIVYLYAGLAKLNTDWLVHAMPLKIWLPSRYDLPLLGDLLQQNWVIYAFSWGGAAFDLCIPFLLYHRKTRFPGFLLVIIFHVLTRMLFPIGMFPFIMILSTTIFFSAKIHLKILGAFSSILRIDREKFNNSRSLSWMHNPSYQWRLYTLIFFFAFQLLFPFRYMAYPGELFWTEEGYRFSWRVMLMEKAGYAQFRVVNSSSGEAFYVDNSDFLTTFQEKQMATQPDFMVEYAHFLKNHFESLGHHNLEIYVESYVAINGRRSQTYIDPQVNLLEYEDNLEHKNWIIPFHDTIKGI
jgi:hypothetical protein